MGKSFFRRRKGTENHPVTKVSWFDCEKFINKLNGMNKRRYRLPTEVEWEYACRAGSETAYTWGKEIDCSMAMYGNNSKDSDDCIEYVKSRDFKVDRPAPVKSYPPNVWGLYDMHGNVWEWCMDAYVDKSGTEKGKIRRGGSWFGKGYSCRSANRAWAHPGSRFQTTGFRVIMEVQ